MSVIVNRPTVSVTVEQSDVSVTVNKNEPIVTVQRPNVSVTVNKREAIVTVQRPRVTITGARFGGIADAPKDGQPYERQDGVWILAGGVGGVSNLIITTVAETDLGGLRLVANGTQFGKVVYANNTDQTHKLNIVGVTQRAVLADEGVPVVTEGYMQDPSWNWARGPLYVGLNGIMTQTPPIAGFIKIVGTAVDTDKIQIHLKNSITLL